MTSRSSNLKHHVTTRDVYKTRKTDQTVHSHLIHQRTPRMPTRHFIAPSVDAAIVGLCRKVYLHQRSTYKLYVGDNMITASIITPDENDDTRVSFAIVTHKVKWVLVNVGNPARPTGITNWKPMTGEKVHATSMVTYSVGTLLSQGRHGLINRIKAEG